LAIHGSVTPRVLPRVLVFAAFAGLVYFVWQFTGWPLTLSLTPYEVAGAVLGVLLVLRTNAGYDRWWEARKLWGGIVNQSRNLAIMGLQYGPEDASWRRQFVQLVATFPHVARCSLRGERRLPDAARLLGATNADRIAAANHMPSHVAALLAGMLRRGVESGGIDRFAFLQVERERALLIDHIGACERILKTPLPLVYAIKVRRFLFLFLLTLPFGLLDKTGALTPVFVLLIAYALLALDQIGVELENPFATRQLSHLPLADVCETIEQNVLDMIHTGPEPILLPRVQLEPPAVVA
jgi:putative membrane protein